MTHSVDIEFSYPDVDSAARVEASLRPEVGDIEGDRTAATLGRDGNVLSIRVDADDLVALRAGLNTWTTLVSVGGSLGARSAHPPD